MDWSSVLQEILAAIDFGQILAVLIAAFAIPLIRAASKWLAAKIKGTNNALLLAGAEMAVRFVEQRYKELTSSEKFEAARDKVLAFLVKRGINIDAEDVELAIEAAVEALAAEFAAVEKNEPPA
jgi:hypothetical protein